MAPFPALRVSDYQDPDDDARKAAEAADAAVAGQIDDAFDKWRHAIDLAALTTLLASGVTPSIWDVLLFDSADDFFQPAVNRLTELYDDVADQTELPADAGVYDPLGEPVIAEQHAAAADLVTTISEAARATVNQVVSDGLNAGVAASEIATTVRNTLGLTVQQAKAAANFRAMLERGDSAALRRALRDRRFDATVQRLIRDKEFAAEQDIARIDRMVERYTERAIAYRAKTIANYETMQAANNGRRAAWLQYAEGKGIRPTAVRRFWQTAADERVCPVCRGIPFLNPDGVPLGEKYVTNDGQSDGPPAHGNCRCTERFEFDQGGAQQSEPVPYSEVRIIQ
jgi:hypothetical protein